LLEQVNDYQKVIYPPFDLDFLLRGPSFTAVQTAARTVLFRAALSPGIQNDPLCGVIAAQRINNSNMFEWHQITGTVAAAELRDPGLQQGEPG
jgi:hypothetical protein